MMALRGRLLDLLADRSGGVAILLALSLVPLSIAALGAVDLQRALSTKSELQDGLDAATLAGAREPTDDLTAIRRAAAMSFGANLQGAPITVTGSNFGLADNGRVVTGDASATVDTLLAHLLLGGRNLQVKAHSEVRRAGANLEVALVLDITGSMNQPSSKIASLKSAASDLIDIVVADEQEPFFSKIALAPYAGAVNVGSKADDLRGVLKPGVSDKPGAQMFKFRTKLGGTATHNASTCVTERPGAHAFDDASYVKDKLGRHYPGNSSGSVKCPDEQVMPMTSDRWALKRRIQNFTPDGSTAGQIGVAWGWYLVSPNFAGLWTGEGKPLAYKTKDLVKVVVLMTDGEFNTVYADGVISQDSLPGSGPEDDKINKNAKNGLPKKQALELCRNMKKAGIVVYTVGFMLKEADAIEIMNTCATSPEHAYLPDSGVELKSAFRDIGHDIARLHISR